MIGNWFRRTPGNRPFHLVDSEVAGDVVTRCGRRMDVAHKPTEWMAAGMGPGGDIGLDVCQECRRIVDRDGA